MCVCVCLSVCVMWYNKKKQYCYPVHTIGMSPYSVGFKMLHSDIEVSELKLKSFYCIHFWTNTNWKCMNFIIPQRYRWPNRLEPHNTANVSLQRGETPQQVSWIWHLTIWWWDSSNAGALRNVEYLFLLPSLPGPLFPEVGAGSLWHGVVASERVLTMGWIEQNHLLRINWIVWNRTVLTFKSCIYAKMNCLK